MKTHPALLLAAAALWHSTAPVRAGWQDNASADLVLGNQLTEGQYLDQPEGIAIAADGQLFISDTGHHRVLRFSSAAAAGNGQPPTAAFGQPDLATMNRSGSRMYLPRQICLDPAGNLWVADTANNRVLRFANALTAASTTIASSVLGQPNAASTASQALSASSLASPTGIAADSYGNLWVGDTSNARVLLYLNAAAKPTGAAADKVFGQALFTDSNQAAGAAGLNYPVSLAVESYGGNKTRLWVADSANHRVTRWDDALSKASGAPANAVLGQPDFNAVSSGNGTWGLSAPAGLAFAAGRLWVANTNHSEIHRYDNAGTLGNGAPGNALLTFPTPLKGLALDAAGTLWVARTFDSLVSSFASASQLSGAVSPLVTLGGANIHNVNGDRPNVDGVAVDPVSQCVFVAQSGSNRIFRYASAQSLASGEAPQAVLGQSSFLTQGTGTSASALNGPSALACTPAGALWVADSNNHRALRYDHAATLPNGGSASYVLGVAAYTSGGGGAVSSSSLNHPTGLCADATSLWVADTFNHRVLRFDNIHTPVLAPGASLPQARIANRLYGQINATSNTTGTTAATLSLPRGLAVAADGRLWVADSGNDRVLSWPANAASFTAAAKVLGQPNFTAHTPSNGPDQLDDVWAVALDRAGALWAADTGNHRIVRWENAAAKANGAAADGVEGQQSLSNFSEAGCSLTRINTPRALCFDGKNRLYAADNFNSRLLRFSPKFPTIIAWQKKAGVANTYSMFFVGEPSTAHNIQFSPDLTTWLDVSNIVTNAVGNALTTVSSQFTSGYFRVVEP